MLFGVEVGLLFYSDFGGELLQHAGILDEQHLTGRYMHLDDIQVGQNGIGINVTVDAVLLVHGICRSPEQLRGDGKHNKSQRRDTHKQE